MNSAGATTPAPSIGGDLGTMMAWNGVSGAITTVGGMIAGIFAYQSQKEVLSIQAEMQTENFQYQVDSSKVTREANIDLLQAKSEEEGIKAEGQQKLNEAVEKRASAEGEVAVQKGIKKDAETTKQYAESKVNRTAVSRMFRAEQRSQPFYGRPVG